MSLESQMPISLFSFADSMPGKLQVVNLHAAGVAKRIENVSLEAQIEVVVE